MHRFKSKSDFMTYFSEHRKSCTNVSIIFTIVQYYLPPDYMINKDYLKLIFQEKKKLLKNAELRTVKMPKFDELSVK